MTQEEKQLLLKDLCARLPYSVICQMEDKFIINDSPFYDHTLLEKHIDLFRNHKDFYIKPYLRPMSSMTDEEKHNYFMTYTSIKGIDIPHPYKTQDWLNAHHFDYRGLIKRGIALEAPEGMYGKEE